MGEIDKHVFSKIWLEGPLQGLKLLEWIILILTTCILRKKNLGPELSGQMSQYFGESIITMGRTVTVNVETDYFRVGLNGFEGGRPARPLLHG
jgi:hypothetical protein